MANIPNWIRLHYYIHDIEDSNSTDGWWVNLFDTDKDVHIETDERLWTNSTQNETFTDTNTTTLF